MYRDMEIPQHEENAVRDNNYCFKLDQLFDWSACNRDDKSDIADISHTFTEN